MTKTWTRGSLEPLLLGVLAQGPQHGYEVIAALRETSGGEFDLPEGSVYPLLHKLEHDGLLASDWDVVGGRRRRTYRITAAGSRSLASARESWRRHARGVEAILGVQA